MTATLDEVLAGVAREHRLVAEVGLIGGRWTCSAGDWSTRYGDKGEHSAHVAAEQSRAVAEWLRSEDVREAAARADAVARRGVTARVNDTDRSGAAAALDAVAGLCGGEGA